MSIQTRTTGLQNEVVRLYCTFIKDGLLMNPIGQPYVEILDSDGVTILGTAVAIMENQGVLYADWYVPANLPLGNYYDRWMFQWDNNSNSQELVMTFSVRSLDSYVNFISSGITVKTSSRCNQLMEDLSNNFIYEAQHIPVYFEQGMRTQQENQNKRIKSYYYFTLNNSNYWANEGAIYTVGGKNFTIFQDLTTETSSSSSSVDSSSSSSSSSLDSSSSNSSSSIDSSSSSNSSSSSSLDSRSSSSTSNIAEPPYVSTAILTCVGISDPISSGTLTKVSGSGSQTITFTSFNKKTSRFSSIYSLSYPNWNQDPSPIVRVNNRIAEDGWHLDYAGKIYFDSMMAPEDNVNVAYNFAYFSKQELQSFLNLGLQMMNGVPPASTTYATLEQAPYVWNAGILLFASITALKRLIFGWSWQEKRIIYGSPEAAQAALASWQDLYKSYNELWVEFAKNVKTLKLPTMSLYVTPEYTLPGGRCMSSDTYIRCMVNGKVETLTIKSAYEIVSLQSIQVESFKNGCLSFENVSKIWMSGNKDTYLVKTNNESIRLTSEHLVYLPEKEKFINVGSMKKDDVLLVNKNGNLIQEKMVADPIFYSNEEVYDIEVPSTENFVGNNIVSHNSRWFRYLYK
jgi:hypothetical protein